MSAKKRAKPDQKPKSARTGAAAPTPPTPVLPEAEPKPNPWARWGGILLVVALLAAVVYKFLPAHVDRVPPKPIEQEKAWTSTVDGKAMLEAVQRIVNIGPRVAGTPGNQRVQAMIKAELKAAGVSDIREQAFKSTTPKGEVAMTNLIGVLPGKRADAIALAAHYDSKPIDDFTFLGANDAASAVSVLFELARKLKAKEHEFTYYFVFLDGEEAFNKDWGKQENGEPDHTYGSRYLAKNMKDLSMKGFILLDMVGDADWSLVDDSLVEPAGREGKRLFSPQLLAAFKEAGSEVFGVNYFVQPNEPQDDHVPFAEEGIPVIDLIDFEYGPNNQYWHSPQDTIDKLSARSLERTGTLVLAALPKVEAILSKSPSKGK